MRVWLDDERPMPNDFNIHVKTATEAITVLQTGQVTLISLDHDLGEGNGTGYEVTKWIAEAAFNKKIPQLRCQFHTQNPVGRENMKQTMRQAYLYWMEERS